MKGLILSGCLSVTPAITWDQMRDSSYISHELHAAQGRNSSRHDMLRLDVRDELVDRGRFFVKVANTVSLSAGSSQGWGDEVHQVVRAIRRIMDYFPENDFEGEFRVGSDEVIHRRIVLHDRKIVVLDRQVVWAMSPLEPLHHNIRPRWDSKNTRWLTEEPLDRLGRANALLAHLMENPEARKALHHGSDCEDTCWTEECVVYLIRNHLDREGTGP